MFGTYLVSTVLSKKIWFQQLFSASTNKKRSNSPKECVLSWRWLFVAGYEYKSNRYCYKTHIGRFQSGCSLSNMGICDGFSHMYSYTAELLKQGQDPHSMTLILSLLSLFHDSGRLLKLFLNLEDNLVATVWAKV